MLEIKNLSFNVESNNEELGIINDVSLSFEKGKLIVITGPNGGGKSTIAKLIMGIEKATSGQILLDGEDITNLSITERAKKGIGYAFQQPPRIKGMTVENLLTLAHGKPLSTDVCCQYLTDVGLCSKDYLNREVDNSLSGGEMKRIEIATLFARDLKVSIFDEPEAGIDLWSFGKLNESFKKIHGESDQTIIIISHQERILELADEIIVLQDGSVKSHGTKDAILPEIMCQVNSNCELMKDMN
ncbi:MULTISPECIES: ABC transporter ATP-binding protein [unclassified Clostridioides]|uniref:ABC transporter ATP-binding protein n=1 Tax=unclassified Clostridioides TaxID=2635829 RepID=UPI001D125171|nr:ATP-binding cassette domain-containing protein [Clostridioides sp. ZZV15-6388]MCC0637766.1 ATP-binding cassette domain-containing protein [Clostridioides sp. ES-S-0001-02]MCC0645741.1 ATP-binding cassette domain-containing protein [Clostridioides sp. ZZV14-6150]MCC0650385.1 ATP-binding cassette domain-containing protein [Clostridioides sp. ZZV15-6598]MCC0658089.1 ATP-binding cassette domain-containing protein [Clostridioides sp. ES-S-0123-01]MCC0661956.1 ATP-binding cassette domain-containi